MFRLPSDIFTRVNTLGGVPADPIDAVFQMEKRFADAFNFNRRARCMFAQVTARELTNAGLVGVSVGGLAMLHAESLNDTPITVEFVFADSKSALAVLEAAGLSEAVGGKLVLELKKANSQHLVVIGGNASAARRIAFEQALLSADGVNVTGRVEFDENKDTTDDDKIDDELLSKVVNAHQLQRAAADTAVSAESAANAARIDVLHQLASTWASVQARANASVNVSRNELARWRSAIDKHYLLHLTTFRLPTSLTVGVFMFIVFIVLYGCWLYIINNFGPSCLIAGRKLFASLRDSWRRRGRATDDRRRAWQRASGAD